MKSRRRTHFLDGTRRKFMKSEDCMADILVVEDDIDIRSDLTEILRNEGYDVFAVADGNNALKHLREGLPPSLILLDLTMPLMNGWDFRKAQLRDPALANIPVVILSGNASIAHEAASLAAVGYIQKPFTHEALLQTAHTHVPSPQPSHA